MMDLARARHKCHTREMGLILRRASSPAPTLCSLRLVAVFIALFSREVGARASQCIEPYLSRKPEKPGDPIPYIMWQKFANHVQKIADSMGTGKPGDY